MNEEQGHPAVVIKLKTSSQKGGTGAELTITSDAFKGSGHSGPYLAEAVRALALEEWDILQAAIAAPSVEKQLEASLKKAKTDPSEEEIEGYKIADLAEEAARDRNAYIDKLEEVIHPK